MPNTPNAFCCGCGKPMHSNRVHPICTQCEHDGVRTGCCGYSYGKNARCDHTITDQTLGLCDMHSRRAHRILAKSKGTTPPSLESYQLRTCRRGHILAEPNLHWAAGRGPQCKTCLRTTNRMYENPNINREEYAATYYANLMKGTPWILDQESHANPTAQRKSNAEHHAA